MGQSLCELYKLDATRRQEHLQLAQLEDDDHTLVAHLHSEIIKPNADDIIDEFYDYLLSYDLSKEFLNDETLIKRLKNSQYAYLMSFGIAFDTPAYFENRLNVGFVHARVDLPIRLYLYAYRKLTQLIINRIQYDDTQHIPHEKLVEVTLKVSSLDIALAIETYHTSEMDTLEHSIDEMRDEQDTLRMKVELDSLTQVASREHILKMLQEAITDTEHSGSALTVIMADLDHFKKVNDQFGHQAGDDVLRATSKRIKSTIRDWDSIGRYGGEEFLILLRNTGLATANLIAERIRKALLATPIHVGTHSIEVTLSQGIAVYRPGDTADELIARADALLYEAKAAGRNCSVSEK